MADKGFWGDATDNLTFDDAVLDTLRGLPAQADHELTWCAGCMTVSMHSEWAEADDKCPHCQEPFYSRFYWSELRQFRPSLPERPKVGERINVHNFS